MRDCPSTLSASLAIASYATRFDILSSLCVGNVARLKQTSLLKDFTASMAIKISSRSGCKKLLYSLPQPVWMLHAQGLLGDGGDCQYGAQPQCEIYWVRGTSAPQRQYRELLIYMQLTLYWSVVLWKNYTILLKCSVYGINTLFPLTKANIKPIQYQ